tara:strand:+ start:443 stop:700 length:258 start_codon:yes stop_codon:yes gene_type:complete
LVDLLLNSKIRWLEKLKTLNPWSLIDVLSGGIAIVLSVTKGFNGKRVFIVVLGLALFSIYSIENDYLYLTTVGLKKSIIIALNIF